MKLYQKIILIVKVNVIVYGNHQIHDSIDVTLLLVCAFLFYLLWLCHKRHEITCKLICLG